MKKYVYSFNGEDFHWESFKNIQDAVKDAFAESGGECEGDFTVYIGEKINPNPPTIDSWYILEFISEQMLERHGDYAESWCCAIERDDALKKLIDNKMSEIVKAIIDKHEMNFFKVININLEQFEGDKNSDD